jgi:hypothetical protein
MAKSLADLIKDQDDALATLRNSKTRLVALRIGTTPPERTDLNLEIITVDVDINQARTIKAQLQAAGVVVQPMSQKTEGELTNLADKLDHAIKTSAIINAGLDTVTDFIDTAVRVSQIVDQHT